MKRIFALHLSTAALFHVWPFFGSRRHGGGVAGRGARGLSQARAADADYGDRRSGAEPRTTKAAPGHKIFPYPLRGLVMERPNQVWAADITYIPDRPRV
jgi:putative transposase